MSGNFQEKKETYPSLNGGFLPKNKPDLSAGLAGSAREPNGSLTSGIIMDKEDHVNNPRRL